MKKIFLTIITAITLSNVSYAQNDTMYVLKNGVVINKQSIKQTDIDSIIFYKPQSVVSTTSGTITDSRDGNTYNWKKIGNQVWMTENLKYLPNVNGPLTGSTTSPYYYVYDYNGNVVADAKATANYSSYGVLYNWSAAMNSEASSSANPSGIKGACPTGWHLPSVAEWTILFNYIGGLTGNSGKLKETGTTRWLTPNTGATNETSFTATGAGYRSQVTSTFMDIKSTAAYWTATQDDGIFAWRININYLNTNILIPYNAKEYGFSVRCVKD